MLHLLEVTITSSDQFIVFNASQGKPYLVEEIPLAISSRPKTVFPYQQWWLLIGSIFILNTNRILVDHQFD